MSELNRETVERIAYDATHGYGDESQMRQYVQLLADAYLTRAQPDNAPLTLEDLRGMDGDKIKIHYIGHCEAFYEDAIAPYYGDKEQYIQRYNGMLRACDLPLKYYGIEWTATAYRRKPEPEGGAEK